MKEEKKIIKNKKEEKKKNLRIAHIHVWDKKNKGDYAIVLAVQELIKTNFPQCKIINLPVESLKVYSEKNLKKINSCDRVIIGGGGIFYSYFLPFSKKIIENILPPIYLFGLGYIKEVDAKSWPDKNISSVLFLAQKARGIGVRDINTKRFLESNGLKKGVVEIVGDPAIALREKSPSQEIIKKLKLNKRGIKIGLNLNYSGWLGFGKWENDILKAYQETALYFKENHNADIYYLKHHPGEEKIYKKIGIKNIIKVDLAPGEQKYVYSQMDLVIGMMLHVGVMTFGALSPEISVAYDIRNYGFAEFISHRELVVDLDKLKQGELLKRSKMVFSKKEEYKKDFKHLKKTIVEKENVFLQNALKT